MKTLLSVTAATVALIGTAAAQEAYVSAGLTTDEDFEEVGFGGRAGYDFNQNVAIEGEVAFFGIEESGIEADITQFGGYAKFGTPVGETASVHARVGYAGLNVDVDGFGSETEGAFAYGVGGEIGFTPQVGLRADYTRLEGDEFEGGLISAHVVFRFGGAAQ